MVGVRQREVRFDSRDDVAGGGVSLSLDTITFVQDHNFVNGEAIVYDNNGNAGLGSFIHNAVYYPEVLSNTKIKVYATKADADNRTFAMDFNGISGGQGIHKFRKFDYTKTLRSIKVIDGGSGYTNRKLIVDPVGINTATNIITFNNHGFNSGDLINYSTDGTVITGLSTYNQYRIIKKDNNTFKLANSGLNAELISNGTFTSDYSGWTKYGPDTVEVVDGELKITRTTGFTGIEQRIWVVKDTTYRLKYEVSKISGAGVPIFRISSSTSGAGTKYIDSADTGSRSFTWKSPVNGYVLSLIHI